MRLAYFSPFNPQKSGISDYSECLLPYLQKFFSIDLWVNGIQSDSVCIHEFPIFEYSKGNSVLHELEKYDAIIYNIGNNPHFHSEILDVLVKYPGVVILHDKVVYFLITGYYLDLHNDMRGWIKDFYSNYGPSGIEGVKEILKTTDYPLQYPHPERYPLIKKIIENALGIIVHSETTKAFVLQNGMDPEFVEHINHLNFSGIYKTVSSANINYLKKKYDIKDNTLVIASFGYIAPTKRNRETIEVINELIHENDLSIKFLMVGEGHYADDLLNDKIIKTGYVSNNELQDLITLCDIVVNLRYPSMGETSGTLLRAITCGKPCIVTNDGWFSELPDDCVLKISPEHQIEKKELKTTLQLLTRNQKLRNQMGDKAKKYAQLSHDPNVIAGQMHSFIDKIYNIRFQKFESIYMPKLVETIEELGIDSDDFYLRERIFKFLFC